MATSLPIKLKKEPLIDAVFELRFSSATAASVVLPGYLYEKLSGNRTIEQLPIAQLPKPIREADPNLRFAPLSRISWGQFFINLGDFSISVSCKYPYPGWLAFRSAIINVINILAGSGFVESVDRYSMKYVDMIPSTDDKHRVSMLNFSVSIAGHTLEKEPFQLRIEIPRDGLVNAVHVISSAQAVLNTGVTMDGMIVDVDTFAAQGGISMQSLIDGFQEKLNSIHATNKAMFFDCLTQQTILSLEPVYE